MTLAANRPQSQCNMSSRMKLLIHCQHYRFNWHISLVLQGVLNHRGRIAIWLKPSWLGLGLAVMGVPWLQVGS